MDLKPRLEVEQSPHLAVSQGARPIPLHGNRLESAASNVAPPPPSPPEFFFATTVVFSTGTWR